MSRGTTFQTRLHVRPAKTYPRSLIKVSLWVAKDPKCFNKDNKDSDQSSLRTHTSRRKYCAPAHMKACCLSLAAWIRTDRLFMILILIMFHITKTQ